MRLAFGVLVLTGFTTLVSAEEAATQRRRGQAAANAAGRQVGGAQAAAGPGDLFKFAGLSPDEAARAMTLPEGFKVTAFAGEPDVQQPVAMTIDDRGRVWIAEAYAYPVRVADEEARDRILIFEDTDGDGKFDKRSIFADKLNLISGLEVGFGGVWVGAAPFLMFIPDRNGDDRPDGPPQILLDGWAYQDTHETLNSFIWGPDGWLYGCHGVFTHSRVGKPGTPDNTREPINAGIWRYHPTRHEFEVFAWGTSNPWGVDFNDYGDTFLTACVIPHLYHIIQGGRYLRQAGEHFQKHTYADIGTIAKHRHWVGHTHNPTDRARSDAAGGGHAHAGAMIYLGGAWPAEYRNRLFMNNIHGARLNVDVLTPAGSGYVGDGAPDFCKTNDLWSQILYLRSGPDGQVYMIDWYDKNQCHHGQTEGHDRSNGRVFKISYGTPQAARVDLQKKSDEELVALQLNANDWYVRQARRILQERAVSRPLAAPARTALVELASKHADATRRLRGLWSLHGAGGLSETEILHALNDEDPQVRGWAVQLALEQKQPSGKVLDAMMSMSRGDASPVVRRFIASGLQRLQPAQRWDILTGLLAQAGDATDHNLPLLYWYAAEPLADVDMGRALDLVAHGNIPLVLEFMIRRVGSAGTPASLDLLVDHLAHVSTAEQQSIYLRGLDAALRGRRQVAMPKAWGALARRLRDSSDPAVRLAAFRLSVTFGDPGALSEMRQLLADAATPLEQRTAYLETLIAAEDSQLVPVLRKLLSERALRGHVLRGLAAYNDRQTPELILSHYAGFDAAEKRDALATLASRGAYAKALLAEVGAKKIPSTDLTADVLRQIFNLRDEGLNKQIAAVWGVVREPSRDKAKAMIDYARIVRRHAGLPDLPRGRAIFAKVCQQCHTLFGEGGKVGPELTGSNRANIEYILSNILDPSAVMGREYIPFVVSTKQGRVVTGLLREQSASAVTLLTANETVVIPRDEIDEMAQGEKSMMPEDLLKPLTDDDVRALVAYLASPEQTLMLATVDNASTLFNGKDLAGWQGNPDLWRVEDGQLVGTSPGLKKNEFLINQLVAGDFRLSLEVKLTPNAGNSGIQFRSEPLAGGLVKGYQADVGAGWWGKLYEEHGRALLWKQSGEAYVKLEDWNRYEIEATGSKVRTWINGNLCVDLDDPEGAKRGIIALQLHSGPACEVRFRNMQLDVAAAERPTEIPPTSPQSR